MGILQNIREHLPTIRQDNTQYTQELNIDTFQKNTKPTELRYEALDNSVVQGCTQAYKTTALACGYTIDTDTGEDDNIITKEYLTRVFESPEGTRSTRTYADMNSLIWDTLLVMGDCFFEIATDSKYGILQGFKYIPINAIMYNNENSCFQLRRKPSVQYEPYELVHMSRPSIRENKMVWGESLVDKCAEYLALMENAIGYNNNLLYNEGLNANTIISYDKDMSPQNFKAEVQRLNFLREKQKKQGLKRGLIAVKGATVQNSATSTEDMNYMQLLDFAENMILRTFRVPPQLYGKIDTANLGSGSGDSQRKDWKTTFEGESTIVENAFNKTLKYHGFNEKFKYGKIDVIDELYDAQVDQILVSTGIKTRDEARNERGLDKITNSWAGYYR
jgi:hypothetical protein